jgi:hypothetical protein
MNPWLPLLFASAMAAVSASLGAQQSTVVSGSAAWMDECGIPRPIRFAEVQVWNARTGLSLGSSDTTDAMGVFTLALAPVADPVFVRVLARAPAIQVQRAQDKRDHFFDGEARTPAQLSSPMTLRVPRTAEANGAFSILDAVTYGAAYVTTLPVKVVERVLVRYPGQGTRYHAGENMIEIASDDPWDWDVVLHEYGHFVGARLDVDLNIGGFHDLGQNLAKDSDKPQSQLSLAWGEGLATFFSIRAQVALGLSQMGMPRVGDARYTDPDEPGMDFALDSLDSYKALGQDNEVAVSRILYDLVDGPDPAFEDGVSLGDRSVWKRLDAAKPKSLPSAWRMLTLKGAVLENAAIGGVFGAHGAAPRLNAPPQTAALSEIAPEFRWTVPAGYPQHDQFALEILRLDGSSVWRSADQPREPVSLTPTTQVWESVLAAGLPLAWVVHSWRSAAPGTVFTSGAWILQAPVPPAPPKVGAPEKRVRRTTCPVSLQHMFEQLRNRPTLAQYVNPLSS